MSQELSIGLLGFGTVGAGVVKHLEKNGELIGARTGVRPVVRRIADLDTTTDRGVPIDPEILTTDAEAVVDDPALDVIIELIGGTDAARRFILKALGSGKPVVTANKALLAHHGDEIFAAAEAGAADIYYEASTAGGIPIIKALREGLSANHIESIYGILNGTCNYILTRMERENADFQEVLADAQRLGYAEADPGLDIDGGDTAHKTTIMASLAYGTWFGMDNLHVEGIRNLELADIRNAAANGYRIKQLGIIKLENGQVQMRVHPALIPVHSMLAGVSDVFNAVFVKGDIVGETMFYGRGAGQDATASAVIADLVDVCLNITHNTAHRVSGFRDHASYTDELTPITRIRCRYYLRFGVIDVPGVLGQLAQILGANNISIASVHQTETDLDAVPVIFTTHMALEADIRKALTEIQQLEIVRAEPVMIRIEDL